MRTRLNILGLAMTSLLALAIGCERGGAFDPLSKTDGACVNNGLTSIVIPPCGPTGTEARCYVKLADLAGSQVGTCDYANDGVSMVKNWRNPSPTSLRFGNDDITNSTIAACTNAELKTCAVKLNAASSLPLQGAKYITIKFEQIANFYNVVTDVPALGRIKDVGLTRGNITIGNTKIYTVKDDIKQVQTVTVGTKTNGTNDITFTVSSDCYYNGSTMYMYWNIDNVTVEIER